MAERIIKQPEVVQETGKGKRIAIISAKSHQEIVEKLVSGTEKALCRKGVAKEDIVRAEPVVHATELPLAAQYLTTDEATALDGVICIGCLVADQAPSDQHFLNCGRSVARSIMKLNLQGPPSPSQQQSIPIVYGVLDCLTMEQARAFVRAESDVKVDHGWAWAETVLQLASLQCN